MVWITKDSTAVQVDRREGPYLDDAMKRTLEAQVIPCYPTRQAATMPVLHAIQDTCGWLPHQALEEAAEFLGLPAAEVLDTASFYEEYWLRPKGRHVIWVCQSLSCELVGERELIEKIKQKLGIEVGQTTDDGRFTLMTVECLGSCGTAPCALVGQTLHESLTAESFDRIIDAMD